MLALVLHSMLGSFAEETNTNSPATNAPPRKSQDVKSSSTNAATRGDFDSFRIVAQRNIFNPNRSNRPSRPEGGGGESSKTSKTDSVVLVGTMIYEKGNFAFFEGSRSEYRKVLKPEDSIAGYKITDVSPSSVKLEANGKTLEIAVGQQIKRQGEEDWAISGRPAGESSSSSSSSGSSSQSSGASSGEDDEILKKLLKKREEEAGK